MTSDATTRSLNILIVDDSAVTRMVISRALNMCGLSIGEIHQAGNGVQALAKVDEHWVDLATVDMNMPEMGGEELIRHIRSTPETEHLPVLVISSESSAERISEIESLGAGFLHKPFDAESLRVAVLRQLGIKDD
jgi:two-component system chemotaxis response regulator CheY